MSIFRAGGGCFGRSAAVALAAGATLLLSGTGVASAGPVDLGPVLGVTMSISGRITDATNGQGAAGMCANIESESNDAGTLATATTGPDGSYTATWQQPEGTATYRFGVWATADCGAAGRWQATQDADSVSLRPEPGQSSATGVDMQTMPAGRIVGTITDDVTGKPLSGVSVSWVARSPSYPPANTTREVLTGADGSYVLGGLTAGSYWVAVNKTDWIGAHGETPTRSQIGYLPDYAHHVPDTSVDDSQVFSVSVGQDTVVSESIYPADAITGTVTDSATGLPIPSVVAYVWGGGIWDDVGVYTDGSTDALGRYRIDGLGPGTYTVCFEPATTTSPAVTYQAACYKNRDGFTTQGDPVQVDGFGTAVHGIDQSLTRTSSP